MAVYDPPPLEVSWAGLGQTTSSVVLDGATVALMDLVCPSTNSRLLGARVSPVAGTALEATVTLQVAVLPPSAVVTVMSEVPAFTAVTFPLASTSATPELPLFHATALLVAFSGKTIAVRLAVSPSVMLRVGLSIDTPLTFTESGFGCSCSFPPHPENAMTAATADNADRILK